MNTNELIAAIEGQYGIDLSEYSIQSDLMGEFGTVVTVSGIECYSQHMEDLLPHKNPSQGSVWIIVDPDTGLPTMFHRQWTELHRADWLRTDETAFEAASPGGGYTHTLVFRKQNHAVFSGF